MSERSKEHAWKVCVREQRTEGSNPSLSANNWLISDNYRACTLASAAGAPPGPVGKESPTPDTSRVGSSQSKPAEPPAAGRSLPSTPAPVPQATAPRPAPRCPPPSRRPPRALRRYREPRPRRPPAHRRATPCRSAYGTVHPELPSLSHAAPPGVSELVPGLSGSRQSPSPFLLLAPLSNQGPFPPAGITPLHRYYGPLRRPERPGLSFAGCRWARAMPPPGLPVLRPSPSSMRAAATTPAQSASARVARFPTDVSLPRITGGSACASPVSRPARRSLTLRPAWSLNRLRDPSHWSASVHVVASIDRSDCYRLERRLPGAIRTR